MHTAIRELAIEKYPAYKDSGEDWIGEVPEHWEVKKLKLIFFEKKMKSNPALNCGSISFGNVVTKDDEKIPLSTKASYQEVLKGDFLINPLNLNYDLISLRIALSNIDVVVSSGYIVIKEKVKLNKKYFKFLLHRYDVAYMKLLGSGVRQTINFNHIANSLLLFPPLKEQKVIASFLDRKTALIDQAISIKEKQIELLKERRQILIHKAVTRGLNHNVKMKDSGVEWIGEIPEHWEVKRLKYLLNEINIRSKSGNEELLSLSKYQGVIPKSSLEERAGQAESLIGYKAVFPKTLVINKMQAVNGLIAVSNVSGITSPDYSVYETQNQETLNIDYLGLLIVQREYLCEFKKRVTGVMEGFIRLYTNDLYEVSIHLPPIEEQREILGRIQNIQVKVTTVISRKKKEIEQLKEYKATLINNAVTGKIKVNSL